VRGCLTSFFVLIALGLVASWLFLPPIAAGAIDQGLQLAGFHGDGRRVTVVASPPLELLALHADEVRVQASDVSYHGLQVGAVDVTLGDVGLFDRTVGTIDGTLTEVTFNGVDGLPVDVASIGISGTGGEVDATIVLSAADVRSLASTAVKAATGTAPTKVTLAAPNRVAVTSGKKTVGGTLDVDDAGGLVFVPSGSGSLPGSIDLVRPGPDVPLRLESVTVGPAGATLKGAVDPAIFRG
jgi:hypothetical protein